MSHVSLHSDPMANFGMIRQTAAKPEVRGQHSLPYRARRGAPCVALLFCWAAPCSALEVLCSKGCKRNIEEYLRHLAAYILMIEVPQPACWLIKDRDYYLRGIWLRQTCFWSFATKSWRTSFIETRGALSSAEVDHQLSVRQRFPPGVERPESWAIRARV
jgi:hypothetical protein